MAMQQIQVCLPPSLFQGQLMTEQAMRHAADMTLGATMANHRAQEVAYVSESQAFEKQLAMLAKAGAMLLKENVVLKAEAVERTQVHLSPFLISPKRLRIRTDPTPTNAAPQLSHFPALPA